MSDNEQQWPQPENTTQPIAPPSGFVESPGAVAPEPVDWEERFEREHRRSRIFMATTAVAGALLVGSLFYASAQGSDAAATQFRGGGQSMGQLPGGQDDDGYGRDFDGGTGDRGMGAPGMGAPGMGAPGMGRQGPGGQLGGSLAVQQFFASDGSLDSQAVAAFKQQLAAMAQWDQDGDQIAELKSQLAGAVQQAVSAGTITQQQADELTKALGLSSGGSGTDDTSGSST